VQGAFYGNDCGSEPHLCRSMVRLAAGAVFRPWTSGRTINSLTPAWAVGCGPVNDQEADATVGLRDHWASVQREAGLHAVPGLHADNETDQYRAVTIGSGFFWNVGGATNAATPHPGNVMMMAATGIWADDGERGR